MGDVGCHNPPPSGARRPRRHTSGQGLALIPFVTSRLRYTISQACSTTVARYCPFWAYHSLTVLFLGTHERTSQWITHPGSALASFSLNFGVYTEPEASDLLLA
ncbi:hypothetical protein ACFX13_024596 [Malus domestica]